MNELVEKEGKVEGRKKWKRGRWRRQEGGQKSRCDGGEIVLRTV